MESSPIESSSGGEENILVAACGTAAATNFHRLCTRLNAVGVVRGIVTREAVNFMDGPLIARDFELYSDEDDCRSTTVLPLHIELADWADILVIAPIDANTMAKIAGRIADDLLTRVAKSWNYRGLFVFVPDVHPLMWSNPSTRSDVNSLRGFMGTMIETADNTGRMDASKMSSQACLLW